VPSEACIDITAVRPVHGLRPRGSDSAALIRDTCTTENPPELVAQSRPGIASQEGQAKEIGLMGRVPRI
jgi:hypothetical protein